MRKFQKISNFIELKENLSFSDSVKIKHISEGNRLIDVIATLNENTNEFNLLTESEKYNIDNIIWEAIFQYSTATEEVFEGFWNSVVKGAKELSNKGLSYAKKIVDNIGQLIKDMGQYISTFFEKAKAIASAAAQKSFSTIKGKLDNHKGVKIKQGMKEDVALLKATVAHFRNKAVDIQIKKNVSGAAALANKAGASDEEGHDSLEKRINQPTDDKQNENNCFAIANAINEIRAQGDFNFSELIEVSESYNELTLILEAEDAGQELEVETKERKSKILSNLKKAASISNIIGFITSGIVKLFENVIEKLMQKNMKGFSQLCKKSGGPGVYEFLAISAITAIVLGLIMEFALETIGDLTGSTAISKVSGALHSTSPLYLLGHVTEAVVPGTATFAKAITIALVAYMGVDHLYHKSDKEQASH
jgi:hypothetical protein